MVNVPVLLSLLLPSVLYPLNLLQDCCQNLISLQLRTNPKRMFKRLCLFLKFMMDQVLFNTPEITCITLLVENEWIFFVRRHTGCFQHVRMIAQEECDLWMGWRQPLSKWIVGCEHCGGSDLMVDNYLVQPPALFFLSLKRPWPF